MGPGGRPFGSLMDQTPIKTQTSSRLGRLRASASFGCINAAGCPGARYGPACVGVAHGSWRYRGAYDNVESALVGAAMVAACLTLVPRGAQALAEEGMVDNGSHFLVARDPR